MAKVSPTPSRVTLLLIAVFASTSITLLAQEAPLTNKDVVALCKAGLGDDLVIAKIKQASRVDFQVGTSDLLALREQGVSEQVLKAMVERSAPPPAPPTPAPPAFSTPQYATGFHTVTLSSRDGDRPLTMRSGHITFTGFGPVQHKWLNFSGLHSPTRSTDRKATILITTDSDPSASDEFVLVTLDVDSDDKVRSLNIRSGRAFRRGVTEAMRPDNDSVVPFTTRAESAGVWRLVPKAELQPGEYGLFTGLLFIYDFGVD